MIEVECPNCKKLHKFHDNYRGRDWKCHICKNDMVIEGRFVPPDKSIPPAETERNESDEASALGFGSVADLIVILLVFPVSLYIFFFHSIPGVNEQPDASPSSMPSFYYALACFALFGGGVASLIFRSRSDNVQRIYAAAGALIGVGIAKDLAAGGIVTFVIILLGGGCAGGLSALLKMANRVRLLP